MPSSSASAQVIGAMYAREVQWTGSGTGADTTAETKMRRRHHMIQFKGSEGERRGAIPLDAPLWSLKGWSRMARFLPCHMPSVVLDESVGHALELAMALWDTVIVRAEAEAVARRPTTRARALARPSIVRDIARADEQRARRESYEYIHAQGARMYFSAMAQGSQMVQEALQQVQCRSVEWAKSHRAFEDFSDACEELMAYECPGQVGHIHNVSSQIAQSRMWSCKDGQDVKCQKPQMARLGDAREGNSGADDVPLFLLELAAIMPSSHSHSHSRTRSQYMDAWERPLQDFESAFMVRLIPTTRFDELFGTLCMSEGEEEPPRRCSSPQTPDGWMYGLQAMHVAERTRLEFQQLSSRMSQVSRAILEQ